MGLALAWKPSYEVENGTESFRTNYRHQLLWRGHTDSVQLRLHPGVPSPYGTRRLESW